MKKVFIFGIALITIYIAVFFIPDSAERFALSPEKISEFWRFATYPFAHLNARHLIENVIALSLVIFIAFELKTLFSDLSSTYMSSGFLSVLPVWLAMRFTALGASNAIFGGFGLISQEARKYEIKGWIIFALLTGVIFIKSVLAFFSGGTGTEAFSFAIKQDLSHFSGLVFGAVMFFIIAKIKPILTKRKRQVLRRASA